MRCGALAICFLLPPMWQRFVVNEPEQSVSHDMATPKRGATMLQNGRRTKSSTGSLLQVQVKNHEKTSFRAGHELQGTTAATPIPQFLRPSFGGQPEVVEFGIYVKNFFGMQLDKNLFSLDVVLTLCWTDPLIFKLIPAGANRTTVSQDEAQGKMWLPDIVIVNNLKVEEISTAIDIFRDGKVTKTQRILLSAQQHFDVTSFPFDVQTPKIVLSSRTFMTQDLVLKAMDENNFSGVKPGLFNDHEFHFESAKIRVSEEVDANLQKSRGELTITLRRDWKRHLQTTILPEIFLTLISFTVFWMPRSTPFAMPRVATNLISFLTLMTLSINTSKTMLPSDRAGMAWIELFADSMQTQNCLTLLLNVFVDWVYNTMDLKKLGEKMTSELAIVFPLMGTGVVIMCFRGRSCENLEQIQSMIRLWVFIVQFTWICHSIRRVREERSKAEARL